MATLYELLSILFGSFILNLIPFAGPSNLFIASNAALAVDSDPFSIGFLVALGSASAKFIHYLVTFFISDRLGEERRKRLDIAGLKIRRWAMLLLFVVAATPLPDEPIIVPLGLLKYNPVKLYLAYFGGKLIIGVVGAYFGAVTHETLTPIISEEVLIAASVVLTIALTVLLLKFDLGRLVEKLLRKKTGAFGNSSSTAN